MFHRFFTLNVWVVAILSVIGARDLSDQASPPKIIKTVAPYFDIQTVALLAPGFNSTTMTAIPGNAILDVEISNDGKVLSSRFIGGHPYLMTVTKTAVNQWVFEPVVDSSEIRKVKIRFDYNYEPIVEISPYKITLDVKYDCPNKLEIVKPAKPPVPKISEKRCKVHGQHLRVEEVVIAYGLMGYKKGFLKAEEKYFPNDNLYIGGGCVINTRQYGKCEIPTPKFGEISYCQKCRTAATKWEKAHKNARFE